ncbi:hypothetical protein SAMN05444673_3276 [Bacillus sp. OV166]|nr:hypothetical protein SAMN05444673_3276 [Bacillus sp. OV166]
MTTSKNKAYSKDKLKRVLISLIILSIATTIMIFDTYNESLTKSIHITFGLIYMVIIVFTIMFAHKNNNKN